MLGDLEYIREQIPASYRVAGVMKGLKNYEVIIQITGLFGGRHGIAHGLLIHP